MGQIQACTTIQWFCLFYLVFILFYFFIKLINEQYIGMRLISLHQHIIDLITICSWLTALVCIHLAAAGKSLWLLTVRKKTCWWEWGHRAVPLSTTAGHHPFTGEALCIISPLITPLCTQDISSFSKYLIRLEIIYLKHCMYCT